MNKLEYIYDILGYDINDNDAINRIIDRDNDEIIDYMDKGSKIIKIDDFELHLIYDGKDIINYDFFFSSGDNLDIQSYLNEDGLILAHDMDDEYYEFYNIEPYLMYQGLSMHHIKLETFYRCEALKHYKGDMDYLNSEGKEFSEFIVRPNQDSEDAAKYYLAGYIDEVEIKANKYTDMPYYICSIIADDNRLRVAFPCSFFDGEPKHGDLIEGSFIGYSRVMPLFRGYKEFKSYAINSVDMPNIGSVLDLYYAIHSAINIDTALDEFKAFYKDNDKSYYQSLIIAILMHDLTGATIMQLNGIMPKHYFNLINGYLIDLASEHYDKIFKELNYDDSIVIPRGSIIDEDVLKKLEILKTRVRGYSSYKDSLAHTYYSAVGYEVGMDYTDDFNAIIFPNNDGSFDRSDNKGNGAIVSVLDCGGEKEKIEAWFYTAKDDIIGQSLAYSSPNLFEINNVRSVGMADGDKIMVSGVLDNGLNIEAYSIGFNINNKFKVRDTYKIGISLFSERAIVGDYNELKDKLDSLDYGLSLIELYDENDQRLDMPFRYRLCGDIISLSEHINRYTNRKYYSAVVDTRDLVLEVMLGANQIEGSIHEGSFIAGIFYMTGRVMRLFEGFSYFKSMPIEKSKSPSLKTVLDLYRALYESYSIDSAYYYSRGFWSKSNRTIGQCAVTAMLVYDLLGGEIRMLDEKDWGQHYFNVIDGHILDLTTEQFDLTLREINYKDSILVKREAFKSKECLKRYACLVENLKRTLKRMDGDNND